MPSTAAGADDDAQQQQQQEEAEIAAKHQRLAAITEMIHTASLVHDDVLDGADTRRGGEAVHKLYSTKAAVLSGDFLLARASVALARLGMTSVTQEMAKSLEALVQGEIMQLQSSAEERLSLEYYLTKSYCKTASLMAFSCKSAALLSGHARDSEVAVASEKFGYHFGLAFQVRAASQPRNGRGTAADQVPPPSLRDPHARSGAAKRAPHLFSVPPSRAPAPPLPSIGSLSPPSLSTPPAPRARLATPLRAFPLARCPPPPLPPSPALSRPPPQ